MATLSTNLQLTLMEDFDKVSASVLADNFTKIDTRLGQVANDLDTTEAGWVLDARQGSALVERMRKQDEEINKKLSINHVVNNLDTIESGSALDARQGKVLAELANGKVSMLGVTATLTVAGWAGSGPYTQTVSVSGVTAGNTVIVSPAPASFIAWGESGVRASAQTSGKLTFTAEAQPAAALSVNVLCLT